MPAKRYNVDLSHVERAELEGLTHKGQVSARKMKRAQILLKASDGWRDAAIAAALDTGHSTVERTRRRFVEGGLAHALNEAARPGQKRRLDGRAEAHLIALACSERPDTQARWSLRLLADKLVELAVVDSVSYETVRQTLKKTTLNRGK
ncbi:MAG: helix-turn-helix domain-containing protein [Aggregatilineales bacterium]